MIERVLHELPPAWLGYRWIRRETLAGFRARHPEPSVGVRFEVVHPETRANNPLPRNVAARHALPDERGWWGYSFRDVPERVSGETCIATLADARVVWYHDEEKAGDFYPAVLAGGRALDLRELRFRPRHAAELRRGAPARRLERATWVLERVYHNHSHWLTAHLPKLLLLRARGGLADVLLPAERTPVMDASLQLAGITPGQFRTFTFERPLEVRSLRILATDRFRPELLRLVPAAFGVPSAPVPRRRIFISRAGAARRRLANEDDVWPLLEAEAFERVRMEDLSFAEQVALMKETAVLVAPHGAGLTNLMFCPAGAHIVEIADPGFPNPNFYALSCAMGHHYWVVRAESLGDVHPLEKDLRVNPSAIREVLRQLPA